jgi:hypothetical protein
MGTACIVAGGLQGKGAGQQTVQDAPGVAACVHRVSIPAPPPPPQPFHIASAAGSIQSCHCHVTVMSLLVTTPPPPPPPPFPSAHPLTHPNGTCWLSEGLPWRFLSSARCRSVVIGALGATAMDVRPTAALPLAALVGTAFVCRPVQRPCEWCT